MNRHQTLAVAIKEALDAMRDRRSLLAVAGYVLMGPALIWLSFTALAERESMPSTLTVPSLGAEALPGLAAALKEHDIVLEAVSDVRATVEDDPERALGLQVVDTAAEDLAAGTPVRVSLVLDESDTAALGAKRRLQQALAVWAQELTTLRVIARGVAPSVVQPLDIQTVDLSTSAERAALLLGGFQVFLLIAAFVGTMNVVIAMVAGERERHSLEILLAQPVSPLAVITGKWLVATAFGLLCGVLTVAALAAIIPRLPLGELGLAHVPGLGGFGLMAVVAAALAPFAASFQMVAASFARTFKEAQTYLSFSFMVPMFVAMGVQLLQPEPQLWMQVTPLVAHQQLLDQILREQWPSLSSYLLGLTPTVLLSVLLVGVAAWLHGREQILKTA